MFFIFVRQDDAVNNCFLIVLCSYKRHPKISLRMSLSVQAETVMLFHLFFQYVKDRLIEVITKKVTSPLVNLQVDNVTTPETVLLPLIVQKRNSYLNSVRVMRRLGVVSLSNTLYYIDTVLIPFTPESCVARWLSHRKDTTNF